MSVYLITAREVGRVKIGCAYDPRVRLEKLQAASPVPLALEALLQGAYEEERAIHKLFADDRLHGEWFTLTDEIEAVIAANPAPRWLTKEDLQQFMPVRPPRNDRDHDELHEIKKRLARGDIHFPFRERAEA